MSHVDVLNLLRSAGGTLTLSLINEGASPTEAKDIRNQRTPGVITVPLHLKRSAQGYGMKLIAHLEGELYPREEEEDREEDHKGASVLEVFLSSPAEVAGIKTGDRLVRIDDTDVRQLPHSAIIKMLQSKDEMNLTVERAVKPQGRRTVRLRAE